MTYEDVRNNPDSKEVLSAVEFVENTYPKTATRYKELGGNGTLYKFFCVKQKDYGPENIRGGHDLNQEFGRMMSVREIGRRTGDKVARISNITMKSIQKAALDNLKNRINNEVPACSDPPGGRLVDLRSVDDREMMGILNEEIKKCEPANESLEDSLVDTSIYGVIAILVYEGIWGQ